jgi:hypothetical protein
MRRLLVAAVLFAPLALHAQQQASTPDVAAQRQRLERSLDARSWQAVARIVDAAARDGLPPEPLLNKAAEGTLRGVSGDVIRTGVQRLAQRLAAAKRALAPASRLDIEAGAEALGAGVPAGTLTEIRRMRPDAPVHVELGVLAQLVASGVPVGKASEKIQELIRIGSRPAQIIALGDSVRSDVAGGHKPIDSFDARARGIIAANSTGGLTAADGNVEMLPGFQTGNNQPGRSTNAPSGGTRAPRKP